jgi:EAL domain-containing protein (putative c-di-GMP-specific phosphodiesterase class I)
MAKDPATATDTETDHAATLEKMESPAAKARVLVADDEPAILSAFELVLSRAGFEVHTAENGAEAVRMFESERFDAVVTDLTMPEMDGLQLLRAIREHDLDVPVVIITAAPSLETAIRALEYGALRYLLKPVRHAELVKVVQEAVRLHQLARLKREALALAGSSDHQVGDQAGLEAVFERALGKLFMVYHPIIKWSDRRVFGYETLLRSREEAMPHPGALFDAAERLRRLPDLGRAVRRMGPEPLLHAEDGKLLLINLHTADLDDEELYAPDSALAAMADRAILEITERASLDHVKDVRSRVKTLRDLGYRIAVDDLGAGYAGLTSFSLLEPEVVKLDMSLVRDVHKIPTKQKLIRSMVGLCREMGIELIAEGIETAEERDMLVELGCDLFQGFLFAKPGDPFPEVAW